MEQIPKSQIIEAMKPLIQREGDIVSKKDVVEALKSFLNLKGGLIVATPIEHVKELDEVFVRFRVKREMEHS